MELQTCIHMQQLTVSSTLTQSQEHLPKSSRAPHFLSPLDRPHRPTVKTGRHGTFSRQLEEKVPDSLL